MNNNMDELRKKAIKETNYCLVMSQVKEEEVDDNSFICLERIVTKQHEKEEIRLAWWQNGRQVTRPADIDADNWVKLFAKAVSKESEVFTADEKLEMLKALLK